MHQFTKKASEVQLLGDFVLQSTYAWLIGV